MASSSMDALFETLRSSTNNDARRAATAQLRQLQSEQPDVFLQHTYDGIASADMKAELRFFLCTLVLAFLDEAWHNGVSKESQERFAGLYVRLAITESFPSVGLARKVGVIVAVMARRSPRKAQVGSLPPLIHNVVATYVAELDRATSSQQYDRVCYTLLYTHLLLKELQGSRVGNVFDDVCRMLATSLSHVFGLLPGAEAMLAHYDVCLYLLKCSLRIFGRSVFDPAFCYFALDAAWRLAAGLGQEAQGAASQNAQRQRLLEYTLKILETTVVYFPARLHELGAGFFIGSAAVEAASSSSTPAAAPPHGLFSLLVAVVRSPVGDVVSEKAVCRAMRLFTSLLAAEEGDPFIAAALQCFTADTAFAPFLQCIVSAYLADATTAEMLAEWLTQPERVAAELDVDMDDEGSMMSCAEQLFLAFTGSPGCATASLAAAWGVVNQLLHDGEVGPITAALHAIGIGYYTMASEDNAAYLTFLRERLLPLLDPAAVAQTSPFITRRVVWLVGMWCESVTDSRDRHAVLAALEAVLQHAMKTQHVVLLLVALKSTENFVSDNQFALSDMTSTLVTTVLRAVETLLMGAQSPTTVKELAGLVHVLIEKDAVQAHGELLLSLFVPPVRAVIQSYETHAARAGGAGEVAGMDEDEDENEDASLSSLGMLLECIGSSVRCCLDDAAIWSLFSTVVLPCITPSCPTTPWAEDNAWELLLVMAQSSHHNDDRVMLVALQTALQHTQRDFSMLPTVFRVVHTLLLLRGDAAEGVIDTTERIEQWVALLRDSPSAELCGGVAAVVTTVARLSAGPLRATLCRHAVHALVTSADVQGEQHTVLLAMVLAVGFGSARAPQELEQLLQQVRNDAQTLCAPPGTLSSLLEQVVLLLDVSPSALVSRALAGLLRTLCNAAPADLSAEDQAMVQRAVEGVVSASAAPLVADPASDEALNGEQRSPQELLLEWLGDEDVPSTSPHFARLMEVFAPLLQL